MDTILIPPSVFDSESESFSQTQRIIPIGKQESLASSILIGN